MSVLLLSGELSYAGGWQDVVISLGMLVFVGSVAGMILDDETRVETRKAIAYGIAQFAVAIANFSLGLVISSALLCVGGVLWLTLGYQSITEHASMIVSQPNNKNNT